MSSKDFFQVDSCEDVDISNKKNSFHRYRIHSPKGKKDRELEMYTSAVQSKNQNFRHFKFDTAN
jgi:hypothetical protein